MNIAAKFVVPEIIGGTLKIWAVPRYAHAPFSPKFFMALCLDGPRERIAETFAVRLQFWGGLRTPNLGEEEAVGVVDGTVRKSVCNFL